MDLPEPSPAPSVPSLRWRWAGPLVFAVVLAGTLPSLPHGVRNWDNEVKLQAARNLARGRGPTLTERTPDDATYVIRGPDGRGYAPYPPLAYVVQLVTLAAFPALGDLREGAGATLVLALLGWALVAWGRAAGVSPHAAVAGALLATLGTMLWPMAAMGYDVLVEALALSVILRAGTGDAAGSRWALAGLAFGAAIATRLGASVLGFSAALLLLAQRPSGLWPTVRRSVTFAVGALPGVALVLWFNWLRSGSPLAFSQLGTPGYAQELNLPWWSSGHLEGMAGLLVSPGKGLFWYAPPLLGVLAAAVPLARRHGPALAALGVQLATSALVFGRFRYWHGDWAWGPRYVAALCIAAAPLAWWLVARAPTPARRGRLVGPAVVAALIALQALPVVGQPVEHHFALPLSPLAASGRLVTRPVTRPPEPPDSRVLYFEPVNSPFVSLARGFGRSLGDPQRARLLAWDLARAAIAPLLALALLAAARRPGVER
jgi:hypothetical protein